MITLITCTGHRPEAFNLCYEMMRRQTLKFDQWIVVNDAYEGEVPEATKEHYPDLEIYTGPRPWKEGLNTQRFNMEEALKHVKGDYIFVIEDDDYYHRDYLITMKHLLAASNVAGEGNAKYYHLGIPGFKEMRNLQHASLCQTAFRKEQLPLLTKAINSGELYFDIVFWRLLQEAKISNVIIANSNLSIGIKGMPGRSGIGVGHKLKDYQRDSSLKKLEEWIGSDIESYRPFIKKQETVDGRSGVLERRVAERKVLQPQPGGVRGGDAGLPADALRKDTPSGGEISRRRASGVRTRPRIGMRGVEIQGADPSKGNRVLEGDVPSLGKDESYNGSRMPIAGSANVRKPQI